MIPNASRVAKIQEVTIRGTVLRPQIAHWDTATKQTEAAMSEKVKQAFDAQTAAEALVKTITAEQATQLAQKDVELDQVRKNAASASNIRCLR